MALNGIGTRWAKCAMRHRQVLLPLSFFAFLSFVTRFAQVACRVARVGNSQELVFVSQCGITNCQGQHELDARCKQWIFFTTRRVYGYTLSKNWYLKRFATIFASDYICNYFKLNLVYIN